MDIEYNIRSNIARLNRRLNEAANMLYDPVVLEDLSHCLRLWADMKDEVEIYLDHIGAPNKFYTHLKSIKLKRTLKSFNADYVYAPFQNGVEVPTPKFGTQNQSIVSSPTGPDDRPNTGASTMIMLKENSLVVNFILIMYSKMNSREMTEKIKPILKENYTRRSFSNWLDSEVISLRFKNEDGSRKTYSVSREVIIRRVANLFGGSHPEETNDNRNPFNEVVRYLMKFKAGNYPVPYFVLFKISSEIIMNIDPEFRK